MLKLYYKFNFATEPKNPYNEVRSQNVKGSALSFWGEHATDMTQEALINQEVPLIKGYLNIKK
ncbi:TPA: hypothetical protein PSX57_002591 [Staphylococcus aureus]|nr:hypothetical protein [Staphylococcus aureus]HDK4733503.1 hypothetical protein [Staphylococcus aureus]HDK4747179.1 hypothetical protein [Staphylococcus aureus]HDK4796554.1 hypothetical protein [Staphylococcus aureus]HDK4832293.1 hypothetical protein [Staphylococcus aureus]